MRPINVPQVFDLPPSLSGPGRSCYAVTRALTRALAYTIVTTYPFALLVSKLSRIDEATFAFDVATILFYRAPKASELVYCIATCCVSGFKVVNGNLSQSELSEDFLYEVPFRLALKSGAVDYSTCLVGTACGYHHEEWEERLAISELRCLHTVHSMMCYVLFLGVVSAFVGLAIGPVTARAIELLTQLIGNGMLPLDLLVAVLAIAVWFFPTYLILRLIEALPVNFHDCQTRPELWEYQCPKFNLLIRVAFIVFLAICLFWASLILTSPLAEVLTQRHVTFNSRVALRIAVAGIIYFGFGVQMFVWIVYLIPTHRALFVKARKPYRPSSYIEIGENHPEFNLEKEVQLARVFLKENRNPENLEMVEGWQERWREILDPESEHDDSDEAVDWDGNPFERRIDGFEVNDIQPYRHWTRVTKRQARSAMAREDGRVVMVTGATSGIGEFTAELLAKDEGGDPYKERCTLVVHGRDPAKVDALVKRLQRYTKVHGYVADLSLMSDVRKLGEQVSKDFPVIHGLLNNAGWQ
ncbi:Chanoclavine-I dehydrogenase easD (ChaDH) (Ergot alkaloid synthesis protein A) [Durusdinium trenchii]|uniref:Chanoclavine-I dehydrogenase easD (ChaDH) (Ergot alkaloid synthesis protein A) n=1 Tax=Durusdinium trenchii TaxID=1381693 RepID=A0ABP0LBR6_9DINO